MVERSEENGVCDPSVDDVVMTKCFREMIYRAMEPWKRSEDIARTERCCQVFEFWVQFLCGESVWSRVVDMDRGSMGQLDFGIIVSAYPGKDDLVPQAMEKLRIIATWYERFIASENQRYSIEGTLTLSVEYSKHYA